MKNIDFQKILSSARKMESENAELLSEMVRIQSFSSQEKEMIEFTAERFKDAGAGVDIDPMGNLLAKIGDGDPIIAIDAHIDTVGVGDIKLWEKDPFSGEISDGKVYGRGASDQKGGAAAMVTAAKIINEMGGTDRGTILFTCTVQEEDCDGLCWQYIINEDKIKPNLVILTEPTNGNINRGHRGRMEMEAKTFGVSCHASAPERGDNAIYKLASVLLELEKLNNKLGSDEFLGKGTLAATKLYSSSPSLCAVADGASVHIDRRMTLGETEQSAVAEILDLPSMNKYGGKVEVLEYFTPSWKGLTYKTKKVFPVWALEENHPVVKSAVECYTKLFAEKPTVDKWTFSTNGVATMGMFGIPSFGYGPGFENQAHAPNEYCPIEHLTQCSAFYAAYALAYGK